MAKFSAGELRRVWLTGKFQPWHRVGGKNTQKDWVLKIQNNHTVHGTGYPGTEVDGSMVKGSVAYSPNISHV